MLFLYLLRAQSAQQFKHFLQNNEESAPFFLYIPALGSAAAHYAERRRRALPHLPQPHLQNERKNQIKKLRFLL